MISHSTDELRSRIKTIRSYFFHQQLHRQSWSLALNNHINMWLEDYLKLLYEEYQVRKKQRVKYTSLDAKRSLK